MPAPPAKSPARKSRFKGVPMNNGSFRRSEEARRAAQAAKLKAQQRQNKSLKERAAVLALESTKIENLRALRLARDQAAKADALTPAPSARARTKH
jgi:hypothetical protein